MGVDGDVSYAEAPRPVDGVLDLRGWDLRHSPPVALDGEWRFFPSQLYTYADAPTMKDGFTSVKVPGDWQSAFPKPHDTSYGYGTYMLRILTDPLEQPVSLWLKRIQASSMVEINGFSEGAIGKPAASREDYVPEKVSFTSTYTEQACKSSSCSFR